jgi:FkbM family methyltransferase
MFAMGITTEIVTSVDGQFLVLSNDAIAQHLKRGDRWEPHFTTIAQKLLSPGDIAVDIGANFGHNAVVMAKCVAPSGAVLAFEPQRIVFQQLCGNAILNNLDNIVANQCALGDQRGFTAMSPVNLQEEWVNVGATPLGQGGEQVEMRQLDDLQLPQVEFIKIDAQGSETMIIRGGRKTLERCHPVMFVEIEDKYLLHMKSSPQELIAEIKAIGYDLYRIENKYPVDHLAIPGAVGDSVVTKLTSALDARLVRV